MLNADVQQAHILPRAVHDVLPEATAAGLSGSYAWALHRQQLLLWKTADGLQAAVRRLHLAEPTAGRTFVEVVPHAGSAAVTVLVCTGGGQLYVWLDANFPAPPFSQRLFVSANSSTMSDAVICALAASPADSGTSLGFLAVIATTDAALHLYHGSQSGVFPRQFYRPSVQPSRQAGVLGALGSVVKALYSEAFDPLHNVQRSSASCMAALQLQLLQLDNSRWKLLVLTPESLDCWLLGAVSGQHRGEQLLWSYNLHGVLSHALQARELNVLCFSASTSQQLPQQQMTTAVGAVPAAAAVSAPVRPGIAQAAAGVVGPVTVQGLVYIWSAHLGSTSLRHEHTASCLVLEEGNSVPSYKLSAPLSSKASMPQADPVAYQWQLAPHIHHSSCLLLAPNGVVMEWVLPATAGSAADKAGAPGVKALGASEENLAVTCSDGSTGNWQLLNGSYGVLEFLATDPADTAPAGGLSAGVVMGRQQEAAALELLDRTVELMFKEYSAGCPFRDLSEGLAGRLERLGVFELDKKGQELLMGVSSSLVDRMAKPGSGGWSSGSLRSLLTAKQVRHDMLLAAYQNGGVLQRLDPGQTRLLFEHAEVLAAVERVLEWQRDSEAAANAADSGPAGVTTTQTAAAAAAIEAAGSIAAAGDTVPLAGTGQQWEVFFSRPTASVPALFEAVAANAAATRTDPGSNERGDTALQQLLGLTGLMQAVLAGADLKAAQLAEGMPDEVARQGSVGARWLAAPAARAAWGALAEACLQLHSRLREPSQRLLLAHRAHLPVLQALLTCFKESLDASAGPHAEELQQEYQEVALAHGHSLLQDAAEELEAMRASGLLAAASKAVAAGDTADKSAAEAIKGVQQALVWPIESMAVQHRCHELLFDTCGLLLTAGIFGSERLLQHMSQEVAEAGGTIGSGSFTFYVMERWRTAGQLSQLLRLGRQGFQQQLQTFLACHPSLLWMSEVQSGMLGKATKTLQQAASAEQISMGNCRRLLCLTKLAAHASAAGAGAAAVQTAHLVQDRAAIRLRQLAVQEQLNLGQQPLTTAQLAEAALQAAGAEGGAAAAVAAVEVLALTPEQQQLEQYRDLWQRAWLAVLQHTSLQQLAAAHAAAYAAGGVGAAADGFEAQLEASPLFAAYIRAATALEEAKQVQADVKPAEVLNAVGRSMVAHVTQEHPDVVNCMQDVMAQVAKQCLPLLAAA